VSAKGRPRARTAPKREARRITTSVFARVALVAAVATFAAAAHALPDAAAVKALLEQRIAQKRAVGLAAVLYDKGTTRIVTAGLARAGGAPIAPDTEFEIGSLTKTFTALLLADAVVRAEVSLDDPATKLLPAAKGLVRDGKPVTLGQLATHTSGLPRMPRNFAPANAADPYADYDGAKLVAYLSGDVLESVPGREYQYSNLGAATLGYALTASRGFERRMRERVLDPLAMRDTAVALSPEQAARFASGHDRKLAPVAAWKLDAFAGAGGLRSTPADIGRYLEAAVDPGSSPLAAAWMLAEAPRVDGLSGSLRIGLAWHIMGESRTIVWHNGQTGGFASMMAFDPAAREGVVVLSNASVGVDDLALHMLEPSIPLTEPPRERVAARIDPAVYDRLAGRYELRPDLILTVRREGDRVVTQATGQEAFEIFPESDLAYFVKAFDAQISFRQDDRGKVTGLVLHQNGRDIDARRIE
jgi:CubicO group peptidase (beta-lactamase class C family)